MSGAGRWREVCPSCGRVRVLGDGSWLCTCGGLLDLAGPLADPIGDRAPSPLARYRHTLPPLPAGADLGMAMTPLAGAGPGRWLKADYAHPTGSFKDRGAAVMVGTAATAGARSLVVDSSGNAGRSAAAHARALGLACTVFLPDSTPEAKVEAMAALGAATVAVPGPRAAAADAAQQEVAARGGWYASHVYRPAFHHGVKTLAFELYEQYPGDLSRATVAVPAGNGTLVLGLWIGFSELVAVGRMAARPRLLAVQSERCAPLAGLAPDSRATIAAGIAIAEPPRLAQVRAAVAGSGGRVETVSEAAIAAAREELSGRGHDVEPTGAVAWAAAGRPGAGRTEPVIAVLTGH